MREIEFRAWIKPLNKMVKVERLCLYDDIEKQSIIYKVKPYERDLKYFKDIELMQYTGLKDKNGVKIFEGDIVRISTHNCPEFHGKYEVKYERDRFMLRNHGLTVTPSYPISLEVIGNIYENPELLEV